MPLTEPRPSKKRSFSALDDDEDKPTKKLNKSRSEPAYFLDALLVILGADSFLVLFSWPSSKLTQQESRRQSQARTIANEEKTRGGLKAKSKEENEKAKIEEEEKRNVNHNHHDEVNTMKEEEEGEKKEEDEEAHGSQSESSQRRRCYICHSLRSVDGSQLNVCSRCERVAYCSREHQVEDWQRHKPECKPRS